MKNAQNPTFSLDFNFFRTSADGSSRLCLSSTKANQPLPTPPTAAATAAAATAHTLHRIPHHSSHRPAPIAELLDDEPSKPSSNILDSANPKNKKNLSDQLLPSSSEATLIEENLSGYCEPFGKAMKPGTKKRFAIFLREN